MIGIFDFFIFFAKLQRKRSKRKQLLPLRNFFLKMAKNRLTAKTPHCVRRTVRRLHAVFYHIFLRKKSLMRRSFRRCLLLFQNFRLFWVYPGNPFSGNVLPNSPTHNHLLPLCGGGKKEERLCSEWEAAYSSGKGANEVQRL